MTTAKQTTPRGVQGRRTRRAQFAAALASALFALAAPAAALAAPEDPWEPANRVFYMVHRVLDDAVFGHFAPIFRIIPAPIRTAVRNIIANLGEPGVAANDMLQGHPGVGVRTLGRFVTNTTVGLGGMIDVASTTGLPHHDNDFADTFGRWGAPAGPYLFITMIGPTTVRDGLGAITDTITDPFTWSRFYHRWTVIDARTIWSGLDTRTEAAGQLEAIDNMSTDSYASLRSLYLQNRAQVIASPPGGAPADGAGLPELPDFGPAPDAAAPAANAPAGTQPPAAAPDAPPAPAAPATKPAASNDASEVIGRRADVLLLAAVSQASTPAPSDGDSQVMSHRADAKLLAALALASTPAL